MICAIIVYTNYSSNVNNKAHQYTYIPKDRWEQKNSCFSSAGLCREITVNDDGFTFGSAGWNQSGSSDTNDAITVYVWGVKTDILPEHEKK